jgi:bacterioferritin-associated ferredoxin
MSQDAKNLDEQQPQDQVETEQPEDAVTLLAAELKEIRQALGLGSDAGGSSLMKRLDAIESKLSQPQEQRNLPEVITKEQAASLSFLRKHGIRLEDFSSNRVRIEG